jgi:hypothetical protein
MLRPTFLNANKLQSDMSSNFALVKIFRLQLAEASEEGQGPRRAVEPMVMMMMMVKDFQYHKSNPKFASS